jgi:carbon monoxide dehydrogenase subunit G
MRIVVTGASGNVGTALLLELGATGEHDLVGVSRRQPPDVAPYNCAEWVTADIGDPDAGAVLERTFAGADAVGHLAWLIQPSRDREAMRRTNQDGTAAGVAAARRVGVPRLVHQSLVGADSPGNGQSVDESWPTDGIPTSSYSVDFDGVGPPAPPALLQALASAICTPDCNPPTEDGSTSPSRTAPAHGPAHRTGLAPHPQRGDDVLGRSVDAMGRSAGRHGPLLNGGTTRTPPVRAPDGSTDADPGAAYPSARRPSHRGAAMTDTERTFTVTPLMPVVLNYLKDFSHAEEWDPGTQSCTRTDDGPITVGSTWHNVSKIAGRQTGLTYTLQSLEQDRLTFVGENPSATSTDEITLAADAGGTRITYYSHIEFHGAAKLAGPLAKPIFERLGNETETQLTGVLNALDH